MATSSDNTADTGKSPINQPDTQRLADNTNSSSPFNGVGGEDQTANVTNPSNSQTTPNAPDTGDRPSFIANDEISIADDNLQSSDVSIGLSANSLSFLSFASAAESYSNNGSSGLIGYGNIGNVGAGLATTVGFSAGGSFATDPGFTGRESFVGTGATSFGSATTTSVSVQVAYGNQGTVISGIMEVGYGDKGNIASGYSTITYGNQGAVDAGLSTLVTPTSLALTNFQTYISQNNASFVQTVSPSPVLASHLSFQVAHAVPASIPGSEDSFNITITNAGPGIITTLNFIDKLPSFVHNVIVIPSVGTYDPATGQLTNINIQSGQSITINVSGLIDPNATGTITNNIIISTPNGVVDNGSGGGGDGGGTALTPQADLSVSYLTQPTNAVPGQSTTEHYVLQVQNSGPSTVTSITLSDSLAAQLANANFTPSSGSYDPASHVWSGISLASGGSISLDVQGTLTPAGNATATITDTATVEPNGMADNSQANNSATSAVVLNPAADLAVSFAVAPGGVVPGQSNVENYSLQIQNNGPSTLTSITLSDSLAAQLANAHFTPSSGSYDAVSHVWSGISLASGGTLTLGISGTISPAANATASITDSVIASDPAGTSDPSLINNSISSVVALTPQADLAVSFSTAPSSVVPGQSNAENYTLQVQNNGPSTVTSLTLSDSLAAQLANAHFIPSTGSYDAVSHVWSGISLASGASLSLNITGTISPAGNAATTITDTASVADPSGITDTNAANNSASSAVIMNPVADLAVSFASVPTSVVPGQSNTENYSLQIQNNGPSTLTSITLSDSLAAQLANLSFTPSSGTYNASTHVWSGISLASGGTLTLGISGTISPAANATASITDSVTAFDPAGTTDPSLVNNSISSVVALTPQADLAVSFSTAPSSVVPGQSNAENYTLQVQNNGPSTVTSLTLSDSLAAQLVNAHFIPSTGSYDAVSHVWSGISLASGASLSLNITGTISPAGNATTTITDTASVADSAGVIDTNIANNTTSSAVVMNPVADLAVSFATAPTSIVPGQSNAENYSLQIQNNGPSTLTSITLSDSLVAQLANAHFTPSSGSYDAVSHIWSGISLASGGTLTLGISGTISPAANATASITDSVTASDPAGTTDPSLVNNSISSVVALTPQADLAVSFSTAPSNVVPGQANAENYTLQVQNNGPSTVTSLTLSDSLAAQLANAHFIPSTGSYDAVSHIWSGISLASGASLSLNITGTISPAGNATTTITDTASVADSAGVTDTNIANNTASSAVVMNPVADLAVSFAAAPTSVVPGQSNTENYSLQIQNNGPSTLTSITLSDSLAAQLANAHFTPSSGSYDAVSHVWSGISLASGGTLTLGISGTISPAANATASITDSVIASDPAGTSDPSLVNNSISSVVALTPQADLAVSFSTAPSSVVPGQANAENYTLQVQNNGPSTVTSLTLSDSLAAQLANAHYTPSVGTYDPGSHIWSGISLASGASLSLNITGTISPVGNATTTITDTASVADSSGVTDTNTANNTASSAVVMNPVADLAVSFATAPTSVVPGQSNAENYSLQIQNNGPSTLTSITLSDSLAAQLANAHFTPSSGSYDAVSHVWSGISLASGGALTLGISGTISPAANATASITDSVTASDPAGTTDPSSANNSISSVVALTPQADLAVSFSAAPSSVIPGQVNAENYTLQVQNNGPSTVTSLTLSDSLAAQLANAHFIPSTGSYDAVSHVWSGISLASGASLSLNITGTISPAGNATTTITDTASVADSAGVTDTNTANNTASSAVVMNPVADLAVSFATAPTSIVPGQSNAENYSLQIQNNGPSTLTSITLSDSLAAQLANAHFTPSSGSYDAVSHIWSGISLASGGTLTLGISGTISPAANATASITDSVTASDPAGTTDPSLVNNSISSVVALTPQADLAVSFSTAPSSVVPGQANAENYTLQVQNNGPSTVTSLTLSDSLAAQLANAHFIPSTGSYDTVSHIWSGISLASGASLSLNITGTISPAGNATTTITDTASVADSAGVTDTNIANNTASSAVVMNPVADLAVSFAAAPTSVVPGQSNTENYSLQIQNNGPSTLTSITLSDSLATQLANVSFTPSSGTYNASTHVWSGFSLASGGTLTLGISGTISPAANATASITDSVTASDPAGTTDPSLVNNSISSIVALTPQADLAVSFSTAPSSVVPGQANAENYTLQVQNNGPSTITSLTLSDSLAAQLANAHYTPSVGTYDPGSHIWSGISLVSGASLSLNITGTISPAGSATTTITDTASVADSSGVTDTNTANNSASSAVVMNPVSDLSVSFATAPTSVVPGQSNTENYSLQIQNNGPSTLTSITLSDSLAAQLANAHFTPSSGSYDAVSHVWSGISLASGGTLTLGISGTISPAANATASITDSVTASDPAGTTDPSLVNNSISSVVALTPQADLAVSFSTAPSSVVPGQANAENYTLQVQNNGPSTVTSLTLSDSLAAQLSGVHFTPSTGSYDAVSHVWSGISLASGASLSLNITGTISPAGNVTTTITDTASVAGPSGITDMNATNNSANSAVVMNPVADLAVSFAAAPTSVVPGQSNAENYSLQIQNNGPSTLTSITLSDSLAVQLANAHFTPSSGSYDAVSHIWSGISLASGSTLTLGISGTISPAANATASITDSVTASDPAGTTDPSLVNNSISSVVALTPQADLAVSFSTAPSSVVPGQANAENYTLQVQNNGPSTVTSLTLSDSLAAQLSGVHFTPSTGSYDAVSHVWSGISLASGASLSLNITGTISPAGNATTTITDTASVADPSGITDMNAANNSANSAVVMNPVADLAVSFATAPTSVVPGQSNAENYSLQIQNNGPSTLTSITLSDSLAAQLANVNFTPSSGTYNASTHVWSGFSLASGSTLTLGISGTISPAANATASITDSVTASDPAGTTDSNSANNSISSVVALTPYADLAVSFSTAPSSVIPGQSNVENYTLQVQNNGPSTITSLTLSDSLAAQLANAHYTPSVGTYDPGSHIWSGISLASGASLSLNITGTISPAGSATTTITDTASVADSAGVTDTNITNNTASSAVVMNPVSDLSVSFATAPTSVVPGQSNTENYSLQIQNNGPSTLTSITLSDSLAAQLVNAHFTPSSGSYDAVSHIWSGISLASGGTLTLGISGTISPAANATASITDSVTASDPAGTTDPSVVNNSISSVVALTPQADLAVSFSTAPSSVVPGQSNAENYTLQVQNNGPSTITSLTLSDSLAAQLANVHYTPSVGTYDPGSHIWSGISLASGASLSLNITGTISPAGNATTAITDTASVADSAGVTDTNIANNTASSAVVMNPVSDLSVSFATAPTSVVPGQSNAENYALQIQNNGPSTLTSITLSDSLAAQLANAHFTPSSGSYDAVSHVWSGISLASGGTLTLGISGTISPAANATASITDSVTASDPAGTTDPSLVNNSISSVVALTPQADLAVSFSTAPSSVVPGQANAENYTLQVQNNGPSTVTSLTLSDSLAAQLSGVHFTPSTGSYDAVSHVWSGISLASGASLSLNITGTISPAGNATTTITDIASVADPSGVTDTNAANNSANSAVVMNPVADLAVSFATAPTSVVPGQSNTENYALQIQNNGPSTLTSITLSDSLAAQLANAHFTPSSGSYDAVSHVWSGISLASGGTLTLGISGTISPAANATASITDSVTASDPAGTTDPSSANNSISRVVALTPQADLAVSFSTAPSSVVPGQANAENYTLQVQNNGPSTVTSLTLSDSLAAQLANAHFIPSTGSYDAVSHVWSGISLASGASLSLNITGTISPAGNATTIITDTASVVDSAGVTDTNAANNTASSAVVMNPVADLAVSFATAPTSIIPGQSNAENYSLQIQNNGPSTLTSITLSDSLATQLANAHFTPSSGSYDAVSHVWSGISLASGGTLTLGINGTISPAANATASITDSVIASDPTGTSDPSLANNSISSVVALTPQADLAVSFSTAPSSVVPGQANAENYTLQVQNNGPSTITSLTLSDSLAAQLANAHYTPSVGTYDPGSHIWSGISLASGASLSLNITGTISPVGSATTTITDTASVADSAGVTDTNAANNTASSVVVMNPVADLAVSFATAPISVVPGQSNTENYSLQIQNNGPSTLTSITLSDSLAAQLANAHFTPSSGSYDAVSHVWSGISLASGGTLTLGISGTISPAANATASITDSVTASDPAGTTDSNSANNSISSVVALTPQADLAVSFSTAPSSVVPGQSNAENYTLQVQNNGPSTVTSLTLSDSLAAQLANAHFIPSTGSYDAVSHVWSGISLASGASLSLNITGTISPAGNVITTITDTASVADSAGVTDINTANNTVSSAVVMNPVSDLAVSFATAPTSIIPGQSNAENYSLQIQNNGPSTLTSITLSDSLAAQLANVNFTPSSGTYNASTHAWSGFSLASGGTLTLGISGTISPSANAIASITDSVTASDPAGTTDPSSANNSISSVVALTPQADLAVSFSAAPSSVVPGQSNAENYTLQVQNNGPSTITSLTLSDSLAAQLANTHFIPSTGSYDAVSHIWSGISLASGASLSLNITGTISPAGNATTTITDTASVADSAGVTDTNTANNTVSSAIVMNPVSDLSVSFATAPTSVVPGQSNTENYSLQIQNNGPSTLTSITLSDSLAAQLANVSFTPSSGTYNASTHVWSGFSLASGGTLTLGISGTISPAANATASITDSVTASDPAGTTDSNSANNSISSVVALTPHADLAVSFSTAPSSVIPGQSNVENYTLQVQNNGPSTITSLTLSDSLAAQLANAHYTPSVGTYDPGSHIWSGISLASGASLSLNITGTISPAGSATTTITDTASVADSASVTDTNSANNTATSAVVMNPVADLAVSFATAPTSIIPGQSNTENYSLQIQNNGPSTLTSITLSDSLAAQLANAHFTPSSGSYDAVSHIWSGISLASGGTLTLGISGTISPAANATASIADSVTASDPAGTTDPSSANNSISSVVALTPQADLAVSYAVAPNTITPGQVNTENYTLQVQNNGPSTITSITLSDSLAAQLTNAHYTPSSGTYNATTHVLSGISLAAGQSITLAISGTCAPASTATGTVTDSVSVTTPSGVTDPNLANNSLNNNVALTPQANLSISISPSQNTFIPGSNELYTIVISNTGPSSAYNVSVLDVLPLQGFTNISSSNLPAGVTFNAATNTWSIGVLAAGASDTLYLNGTIPVGATGATFVDQVTASSSDASNVSAQSSIIPTGIVTAVADVDTVLTSVGSTSSSSANVITGADPSPHPGSALNADIIDAYGGAHITQVSFGSATSSFSNPNQVHVDGNGQSYISIAGTYGTLNLYANGNYNYTVTSTPSSVAGSSLLTGSTSATSTAAVMQADWSNVGLYAYTFGTSYIDSAGHLALGQANGQLAFDPNGVGVNGLQNQLTGPTGQINYDPTTNQSEALVVDLKTSATQATVTVSNMFNDESTGEQGLWQAFNSAGVKVGQGVLNSSTVNYGSSDSVGTANIQVLGANGQALSFEYIVFTALPYPNANPANNVLTDSGDYFVRALQYTTASTTPALQDVFTYTMADSNNNTSSTTLTIKGETSDLAVAIANSTNTPVPGASDTYTITITNNGPATVNSIALTDTVMNGLSSLNVFQTYFHNPVYVPASGTFNASTGTWSGLSLATGQSITLTVTGTIDAGATGNLVNSVVVANTSAGLSDPVTANNSAESILALSPQAALSLSMSSAESSVIPGSTNTYTLTLTNTGLSNAYNVSVVDTLPLQGFTNIASTNLPSGVTFNSATDTWTVGTLAAGASITLSLSGTVPSSPSGSAFVNQAIVSSSDATSQTAIDSNGIVNLNAYTIVKVPGTSPYSSGSDAIYQINAVTGVYSGIVPNSVNSDVGVGNTEPNNYIMAIAADPLNGYIYAINNVGLLQINPANPHATTTYLSTSSSIANIGLASAITFSPVGVGSGEKLFAISETSSSPLYSINLATGTATALGGAIGHTLTGIAENTAGNLYGISNTGSTLYQLSTSTGSVLNSVGISYGSGVSSGTIAGLSFDSSGALWALSQNGDIFNISLTPDSQGHYDATLVSKYNTSLDGSGFASLTFAPTSGYVQNALSISQSDSASILEPGISGNNETYTITISNTSGALATNIAVSDLLPSGMAFVSDSVSAGSYNSSTGLWNISSLASGSSATLTLVGSIAALGTYTNAAAITYEDQQNLNASQNSASTTITGAEQHLNLMVSDTSTSSNPVVLEAAIVNHAMPWESIFAPIVLPAHGGQSYISIPTDFSVTAGTQYSVGLELPSGATGQVTINGFIPFFTDVINPASLSGATDSRYGTASSWSHGAGSVTLIGGSTEGLSTVITAGASSSSPGSVVQAATNPIDSNTPVDTSGNVSFVYGTATGSNHYTVTGGNAGDFLAAASDSTHHYALFGGTGSDVILYNKQDASINGGSQGSSPAWDILQLGGNDSISLNTNNNVTSASTANGISGGVQLNNISVIDATGYNADSNGNPIVNTDGTVSPGNNSITLHADDVLDMSPNTFANLTAADSSFNQIANQPGVSASDKVTIINGSSNTTVNLAEGNWTAAGTVTEANGPAYAAYTHAGTTVNGEALVLINTDITHIVGHT